MPFEDSRRLTGANRFFASTGAVLELRGVAVDAALLEGWRLRVRLAVTRLGWPGLPDRAAIAVRVHSRGASLAIAAPIDQLFTATELNEWALCAAAQAADPSRGPALEAALQAAALEQSASPATLLAPVLEQSAALARLERLAAGERRDDLRSLLDATRGHALPCMIDDEQLTIGQGAGARSWPLSALPRVDAVPWVSLHAIPLALVTGSNGKTTTVRLIAACAAAQGWNVGYSCTDGVYVDGVERDAGDYSGPLGTRTVLRDAAVEAAVLETARGGILRRGLAAGAARAAVVTNVCADHFGEYGVDDLQALAEVKLSVAAALTDDGLLVLNADDALLCEAAARLHERLPAMPRIGWFALEASNAVLAQRRVCGGASCAVHDGRLVLEVAGGRHELGRVADMPLTVAGTAAYNVANLAAAALAATALGVSPANIAAVCARFGADPADNPGRLMRFERGGVQVLVDYAHNPEGLRGLQKVAAGVRGSGRLALTLGHAGNRQDTDIERLAEAALEFEPELVVVKENERHLRGRSPGEIPRILRRTLLRGGMAESALPQCASEFEAAQYALSWARTGDVVVLLMHSRDARRQALELLRSPPGSTPGSTPESTPGSTAGVDGG